MTRSLLVLPTGISLSTGGTIGGRVAAVLSLRTEGDVRAVYVTVDPDKLGRWSAAEVE